jgi:ABC-three component (ABC-3C) system Middle Component 4
MDFVKTVADLDHSSELHSARLLILLDAFGEGQQSGTIEGLTKLAKLDFLLRYPVMLQRALEAKGRTTKDVKLEDHEQHSVESEMVRYRFGPWDHRYREFLNILVAKELVFVTIEGRKVIIAATEKGRDQARQLASHELFEQYARRAKLLKRHFNLTATNLMNFIYDTFPEIVSLQSNSPIST